MKIKNCISIIASLLLITTGLLLNAQGIIVHKTDGSKIEIPYNEFDSITTYETTTPPEVPGGTLPLVGTVAEAVDLGLPSGLKWASWNIGATKPEEYGGYYAWGETETKNTYEKTNYKYFDQIWQEFIFIGNEISGTEYDVAHMMWGNGWRMPSKVELQELLDNCSFSWINYNGSIAGCRITGPNGNRIFMPAAGDRGHFIYDKGIEGCYLCGSAENTSTTFNLRLNGDYGIYKIQTCIGTHYSGRSVRAVKD